MTEPVPPIPNVGHICKGCGTDVPEGVRLCVVCKDGESSRSKPLFDTGNHPAPPVSENPFVQGVRG